MIDDRGLVIMMVMVMLIVKVGSVTAARDCGGSNFLQHIRYNSSIKSVAHKFAKVLKYRGRLGAKNYLTALPYLSL